MGMPRVGLSGNSSSLANLDPNEESEFVHDRGGADDETVTPSAAAHPGKFERRRWRKPATFGCLVAPKRDRAFGVAKFGCKHGY
jgi:hypothetical protein